jgi:carboxyl-terminal processing protease
MHGLVIDLRDNPGGDLAAALELADDFLPLGAELVRIADGDGDVVAHAARHTQTHAFPLLLLVDRGTASAAELFAGSLQANGRARLVGERTHGKSSVQKLVVPIEGGALRYETVALFEFPGGVGLPQDGLRPDVDTSPESAWVCARALLTAQREPAPGTATPCP